MPHTRPNNGPRAPRRIPVPCAPPRPRRACSAARSGARAKEARKRAGAREPQRIPVKYCEKYTKAGRCPEQHTLHVTTNCNIVNVQALHDINFKMHEKHVYETNLTQADVYSSS